MTHAFERWYSAPDEIGDLLSVLWRRLDILGIAKNVERGNAATWQSLDDVEVDTRLPLRDQGLFVPLQKADL